MKLTDYIKPPLMAGTYSVRAVQHVQSPQDCQYEDSKEFYIGGNLFRLDRDNIFSVYPSENETGEFGDLLPFIVLSQRTFPWEYQICPDREGTPVPWTALIVLSQEEDAVEKDLPVKDLLEKAEDGIYFPRKEFPDICHKYGTDTCHVVDLPVELYNAVMPSMDDLPYLCHVKSVNLYQTEDSVCAMDGYFSVVCGNRFVPSAEERPLKSTVHLVSLYGMGDWKEVPGDCKKVRLVSLYHWDIFSQKASGEGFSVIVDRLGKNCGSVGAFTDTPLKQEGYGVKKHITRTGELTYSLYRPPLVPRPDLEEPDREETYTADGKLIYDKTNGIFDVTYAAAWQLGRLIALDHPADTKNILTQRRQAKLLAHHNSVKKAVDFERIGVGELTARLAGNAQCGGFLDGGESNERIRVTKQPLKASRPFSEDIADFMAGLRLLYEVPFSYLITAEETLPPESIRFFYVDGRWTDALIQGALSAGQPVMEERTHDNTRLAYLEAASGGWLRRVRQGMMHDNHKKRTDTGNLAEPAATGGHMTGFLLRSVLVRQMKGLQVTGKNGGTRLEILRMETLSDDVLLCIFEGELTELIIAQPQTALRFGAPDSTRMIRVRSISDDDTFGKNLKETVDLDRFTQANGRLDVAAFAHELDAILGTKTGSAQVAFELIASAQRAEFKKNESDYYSNLR